jgi:serine/threonine-protein kinase
MTESGDAGSSSGPTSEPTVLLGERYELGGLLGRGGMADVRIGRDLRLGRTVAIKQLRPDLASDESFQARFRREAQSAAALNHPSIVAVYDTGETINMHGNHIPYIVMEHVDGQTLRDVLRDGRRILPERALSIVADVLSALDYSHRQGIIHRDIKPANVMLTPNGHVKVMDFGIARAVADSSMTQTAAVIGTAQYLSPEQARGETVDARSDIYSTGCLLYELLAGRPPFIGESPVSVAYQHVREDARPPSQFNPDVSENIDNIVAKALAKRTDDRYQSAADMRADIQRAMAGGAIAPPSDSRAMSGTAVAGVDALAGLSGSANTQVSPAVAATEVTTAGGPPVPPEREEPNRPWKWVALVALVLALLGAAVWAFMRDGTGETQQVPSVVGISYENAKSQLETLNFTVEKIEQTDENVPKDEVMEQNPEAGTMAEVGSTITLTVSTGTEQVEIPQLSGYNFDEAKDLLEGKGLVVQKDENESSAPEDEVINSNPPAGEMVDIGSTVTLIVSIGESQVPNVVGMNGRDARERLEDAGFDVSVNGPRNGTVTDQDPSGGSNASSGSDVTITTESADTGNGDTGNGDGGNDGNPDQPTDEQTNGGGLLGLN